MKWRLLMLCLVGSLFGSFFASCAFADDLPKYELAIKDHKFNQEILKVKANQQFRLTIHNQDPSSEEFESRTLVIEKFMGPNKSVTVLLGPLKPGAYDFFGDFHKDTAQGKVIAE